MWRFLERCVVTNYAIALATLVVGGAITTIAGCGDKSDKPTSAKASASGRANSAQPSSPSTTPAEKTAPRSAEGSKVTPASKPKTSPRAEVDNTPRKPATVEEAQRVLDLTTFPLPEGAQTGGQRSIAHVQYRIAGNNIKAAFEFVRQSLTQRGWKEIGETYLTEQTVIGTFGGQGFYATVYANPDSSKPESKAVSVSITNHGNLNLASLPVPPGAKLQPASPIHISYITEMPIEDAIEAVDKLLTVQGWTPYGENIVMKTYKQNAIGLRVSIAAMYEMKDKNLISFSPSLMSADLPAPPEPLRVEYTDSLSPPKQLLFESSVSHEDLYTFYRETLTKAGWKPTTDNPIKEGRKWFMIFRNPAKDLLELETYDERPDNKIRGTLKHQSAAEVAEIDRQIELDRPRREAELKRKLKEEADNKAKAEQYKKDKEAAEKERRRVVVSLPADAKAVTFEADEIKFSVPLGKAKAAAEAIGKRFRDNGWKERNYAESTTAGSLRYDRDDQSVNISYSDTQFLGTEVSVSGFRVDFEKPAAGKK